MTETNLGPEGMNRRALIRKGLLAGGVAMAVPVVSTFNVPAAAGASDPAPTITSVSCSNAGNTKTVTVSGTGIVGATVTVFCGSSCSGAVVGTAVVQANGTWTLTFSNSTRRCATVSAAQSDDGGANGACSASAAVPSNCQ